MTSSVGYTRRETPAFVEKPLTRGHMQEIRLRVQSAHAWSMRDVAKFIGCDHSYLSKIEKGERPITDKFREKFKALEREAARLRGRSRRERVEVILISEFPPPARLELLAKPVKCDRCGKYFMPIQSRQKRHKRGMCKRVGRKTK